MMELPKQVDKASPYDVVIVGAGPAGVAAALTAQSLGLRTAIIDEQGDIGGQILRQPPATFSTRQKVSSPSLPKGESALAEFRAALGIDRYFRTTAWGVFRSPGDTLVVGTSGPPGGRALRSRTVLLATGAYDLPVAFPGWTLPGVMSAGGVQTLIKSQFLRPGRRFVLAGSHPLLLLVADLLLDAGAEIAEVAIARPLPSIGEMLKATPAVRGHFGLFLGLAAQLNRLRQNKVPVRFGTIVRQADGKEAVEAVTLCDVDSNWMPRAGSERIIAADTLVVGYGLLASTELAQQAGCDVNWQPTRGGWIVSHSQEMRTSVDGIFVAGEPAGVKGAELAYLEGQLAALEIAVHIGAAERRDLSARIRAVARKIVKARVFSNTVLDFFAPRLQQLAELATSATLACRCEEITVATVTEFLAENRHVSDVSAVKLACRTGMGFCQGRYCHHTVAYLAARARGLTVPGVGRFSAQAPVRPVTVRNLMSMTD